MPAVVPRDAAVVRCSSCGATREAGAAACGYCGSDFTIHEQDLETICPTCLARIGDRARFCHHCATPIVPESPAGGATDRSCPACGKGVALRVRPLEAKKLTALECVRCAGLWMAADAFRILTDEARRLADRAPVAAPGRGAASVSNPAKRGTGPVYRPCPVCSKRMNRVNFGRRSGVLIDRCREHGVWFDACELEQVIRWIRAGGEILADEQKREEERQAASAQRFRVEPKGPDDLRHEAHQTDWDDSDLLGSIFRLFSVRVGSDR